MLAFYKTVQGRIEQQDCLDRGTWVNMVNPTSEELSRMGTELAIEPDFLRAALDEEETSRVELEENQTLIIIDIPMAVKEETTVIYSTIPLGIVLTEHNILTVCLRESPIIREFADGLVKNVQTAQKTRFVFQILLKATGRFLQYLRQIDKMSVYIEKQLHKSLKNKELIQLLDLQKSLVYFSTSLKADEVTLEKVLRGRVMKLYEEDQELLEDVLIEIKQAIEMATIYSDIMTGTMDAFASVISNNLNIIMKVLTSITIMMTIPNIIFSFYGMNVDGLAVPYAWFPLALSGVIVAVVGYVLNKKHLL